MASFAARITAALLIASLALVGGWASPAVSSPAEEDGDRLAVHTSHRPGIERRPGAQLSRSEFLPGLLNTASGPAGPVMDAPLDFKMRQASTVLEVAEQLAREIYVQGEFILPITQQPPHRNTYVSTDPTMLTQFGMATRNGITGLLAHNYLSGALFYLLDVGEEIDVLYADGQIRHYQISEILSFQKLKPQDLSSQYLDVQTGKLLTTSEVFKQVYRGSHHLTLQTCLEQNGDLSWGLYFVIAVPLQKT